MASESNTKYSSQKMLNDSYDATTGVLAVEEIAYDGSKVPQRSVSKNIATKVTVSGTTTYVAKAPIGSSQASAVWQAKKIDASSGIVITWADNGNFSQVASDLTVLTYV